MDRWKMKELKRMELGGNKAAAEYYEQTGMMSNGKPDHEAAPHARYKQELAAKVDAVFASMQPQQPVVKKEEPMPSLANPFEVSDTAQAPVFQQPVLQAVEVPVAAPKKKAGLQM